MGRPMKNLHEERPTDENSVKRPGNDYEYIRVQVTPEELSKGNDKAFLLRTDGWEKVDPKAEPEWDTGDIGGQLFYMKISKEKLAKLRKERSDRAMGWNSTGKVATHNVEGAGKFGSPIVETASIDAVDSEIAQKLDIYSQSRQGANS